MPVTIEDSTPNTATRGTQVLLFFNNPTEIGVKIWDRVYLDESILTTVREA